MKRYINIFLFCTLSVLTFAQLSPEAEVSFITCSPGEPSWSKYGHTALRIKDPQLGIDNIYNYGMFDFNQPNFYSNFIKGQTDYILGKEDSTMFYFDYEEIGREIDEKRLNLTQDEINQLFLKLEINALPKNRSYRYNFVFNNCATKPYELLNQVVSGKLESHYFDNQSNTFRQLIDFYSGDYTWGQFGISLAFGRNADTAITPEQRLFLPEQLLDYLSVATIDDNGTKRELMSDKQIMVFQPKKGNFIISPEMLIILLVLLIIIFTIRDLYKHKISWWLDRCLFLIYLLVGLLLAYLPFSEHPLVEENFNLLFFNPLMFIPLILSFGKKTQQWLLKGELIFAIYSIAAIIIYLASGQHFHLLVVVPIIHAIRIRLVWYRNIMIIGQKQVYHLAAKIGIIAILLIQATGAMAQESLRFPRLTVVIVIDGLNQQAVNQILPTMSPGGLRIIIENSEKAQVYFPQLTNGGCETTATLMTGTTPFYHGISTETKFNQQTQKTQHILFDNSQQGIGTNVHYSPRNILAPTLTDMFRLNNPQSRIYAIGINAENTILMAGHAANACVWLNTESQQWCTTTYYPHGLHPLADQMNTSGMTQTILNQKWTNQFNISDYQTYSNIEQQRNGFRYSANKKDLALGYNLVPSALTPHANQAVVQLACNIQQQERLGEGLNNDLLLLELNCNTPNAQTDYLELAEQQDMYLRLNQQLQTLIQQLHQRISAGNYQIIVVGQPRYGHSKQALANAQLPSGTFNVAQAAALLNTYLMAIYGNGQYIIGGHNNSIYIDQTLLTQKQINTEQFTQYTTQFLTQFEGIQTVYTAQQVPLLQGTAREAEGKLRRSFNKQCFGQIVYLLQPGYKIVNKDQTEDKITDSDPQTPIYVMGRNIKFQNTISATQIMNIILN